MSDIENYIGNTPLVLIDEVGTNQIYGKLEGNNPAGSIKDRPAIRMIKDAESSGFIKKGDTLIEATSGNTGIALAMAASIRGFKIKLIMPESASIERIKTMKAYGAEVILVTKEQDMEGARDLAIEMSNNGEGHILNQFSNKSIHSYPFGTPKKWHTSHLAAPPAPPSSQSSSIQQYCKQRILIIKVPVDVRGGGVPPQLSNYNESK